MRETLRRAAVLCFLVLVATPIVPTRAQRAGEDFFLDLRKDFGFSMGGRIQGRFTLTARGPDELSRVAFLIDGETLGVDGEAPFQVSFSTGEYELGFHWLMAVGTTIDGRELRSTELRLEFVSAEQGWRSAIGLVVPLLLLILVLGFLGLIIPALFGRRSRFQIGVYGAAGGAVCPRCGFPYRRNVLSPNLLVGKLERCLHCGKWAVVRRATATELAEAEARWLAESQRGMMQPEDDEARFRRMIENTRFED